jgi:DNA-binding transcriptional ArsR family regulator
LTELTQAGQPNVSKHLAALAQGGLVRRRKQGTSTLYAIADPTVFALCDAVCAGVQQQFATQAHELGLAGLPPELVQGRRRAPREDEEEATAGAADKG